MQYLKSNVTGSVGLEQMTIGDTKKILASNQSFIIVNKEIGFSTLQADGIVGLGLSNQENTLTLIETLKSQKVINNAIFSLFLNNNNYERDDLRKPKSMLTIGNYDLETYSDGSDPKTYKVSSDSPYLWALPIESIHCKDTLIDPNASYAVLDSNHAKIVGPAIAIKQLFDRFEAMYGCGYYYTRMVCDCSEIYSIVKFPSITLKIAGDSFTFNEDQYFKKTSKTCYLMFEGAEIDH